MPRTKPTFPGFPKTAQAFFKGIVRNNNKEWFDKNKPLYESGVKGPMADLVHAVGQGMLDYAPEYITDPKQAIYRIYRDIRFSKDKTPYKTNIAASWFRQNLGKNETAGFYMQLDAKELFIGAGIYMPMPDTLKALRAYIDVHHEEMRKILAGKPLVKLLGGLQGEPAARLPKGFLPGHPAQDLLRHKMYIVWTTFDPAAAYTPKLLPQLEACFRAATPLVEFLNKAVKRKLPQKRR